MHSQALIQIVRAQLITPNLHYESNLPQDKEIYTQNNIVVSEVFNLYITCHHLYIFQYRTFLPHSFENMLINFIFPHIQNKVEYTNPILHMGTKISMPLTDFEFKTSNHG